MNIARSLNGRKILIRGNHDHYSDAIYIQDFGFEEVHRYLTVNDYFLCHYPLVVDKYTKDKMLTEIRHLQLKHKESGSKTIIHGHSHLTHFDGKINASVDLHNFTPIPFPSLKETKKEINAI